LATAQAKRRNGQRGWVASVHDVDVEVLVEVEVCRPGSSAGAAEYVVAPPAEPLSFGVDFGECTRSAL